MTFLWGWQTGQLGCDVFWGMATGQLGCDVFWMDGKQVNWDMTFFGGEGGGGRKQVNWDVTSLLGWQQDKSTDS